MTIEHLIIALAGYIILNCLLYCLSLAQMAYLRHKKGLSLMEFEDPSKMTPKEQIQDLKMAIITPFIILLAFIPLMVYIMGSVLAGNLVEKKQKKRTKQKWIQNI